MISQEALQRTLGWLHLASTVLMIVFAGNGVLVLFMGRRLQYRARLFVERCTQGSTHEGIEQGMLGVTQAADLLLVWDGILRALAFSVMIIQAWTATLLLLRERWAMVVVSCAFAVCWMGIRNLLLNGQRTRWVRLDGVMRYKRGFTCQFDQDQQDNRVEWVICVIALGGAALGSLIKLFDLR